MRSRPRCTPPHLLDPIPILRATDMVGWALAWRLRWKRRRRDRLAHLHVVWEKLESFGRAVGCAVARQRLLDDAEGLRVRYDNVLLHERARFGMLEVKVINNNNNK